MNGIDLFLQLPITAQAAVICFVACASCLFAMFLAAPRQDCFFLRWRPETRFLALLVSPALLILWPIVLYGWFLKSQGIEPDDPDFGDDDWDCQGAQPQRSDGAVIVHMVGHLLRMIADLQPGEVVIAEKICRISRLPLAKADQLAASIKQKGVKLAVPGLVDLSDLADEAC